ncbi:hypothetical protein, partial [Acinetobacter baumannii]|uniref:hypothetical protein n=1 Tax=Acinetobacter baumannii TaxID=470 RepID=UPI000AAABD21
LLGHTPGELPEAAAACNHAPQLSQPIPLGDGAETLRAELPPFEAKKAAALYRLAALLGHTPGELPEAAAACNHAPQLSQPIPLGDGA